MKGLKLRIAWKLIGWADELVPFDGRSHSRLARISENLRIAEILVAEEIEGREES